MPLPKSNKKSLFHELRKKMSMSTSSSEDDDDNIPYCKRQKKTTADKRPRLLQGNKNAARFSINIYLGWIHEGRTVRLKTGGGTRTVSVKKNDTKVDIVEIGKQLFFPDGISYRGSVEEFDFDVLDYMENVMPPSVTVGDTYKAIKVTGNIRLYISTRTKKTEALEVEIQNETSLSEDILDNDSGTIQFGSLPSPLLLDNTLPLCSTPIREILSLTPHGCASPDINTFEVQQDIWDSAIGDLILTVESEQSLQRDDHSQILPGYVNNGNNITELPHGDESASARITTSPYDGSDIVEKAPIIIKINRVNILAEMVARFKDHKITEENVKYSFSNEAGSDASGVSRDIYTSFWKEFFSTSADGELSRVPAPNNKWQKEEWNAVGRILVKGYVEYSIFPHMLSAALFVGVVHGEDAISPELLLNSFLQYILYEEATILKSALCGSLSDDDKEMFFDIFDRMENKEVLPCNEACKPFVLQIAHRKLIQLPKYAMVSMSQIVSKSLQQCFPDVASILKMYDEKKPTHSKIIKLLNATPMTKDEDLALKFFIQYVRAQSESGLSKLLHFVTGADVICVDKIDVEFTKLKGLSRRPIAHTCGPLLQLPATYSAYRELRRELDGILAGDSGFIMDIL